MYLEKKINGLKKFLKYFIVYLLSYYLNTMLLLYVLVENISLQPLITRIFTIPLIVLINFTRIKYWALKCKITY